MLSLIIGISIVALNSSLYAFKNPFGTSAASSLASSSASTLMATKAPELSVYDAFKIIASAGFNTVWGPAGYAADVIIKNTKEVSIYGLEQALGLLKSKAPSAMGGALRNSLAAVILAVLGYGVYNAVIQPVCHNFFKPQTK